MLLSEGMAQPVTQAHQAGRELQPGLQCQKKRAEEAKEGYLGAVESIFWLCRQGIREARAQLGLKLVRNGNGNKKSF